MDDLLYIAVFVICGGATGGLLALCERLMPRGSGDRS